MKVTVRSFLNTIPCWQQVKTLTSYFHLKKCLSYQTLLYNVSHTYKSFFCVHKNCSTTIYIKLYTRHHDTQHNEIQHNDTQHNDIQHIDTRLNETHYKLWLCWVSFMLSVIYSECHKQTHYAECHYAECLGAVFTYS